jgi:hypothetical protein
MPTTTDSTYRGNPLALAGFQRCVTPNLLFQRRDDNSQDRPQPRVGRTHNSFWHNDLRRTGTWHDPRLKQALNRYATKAVSLETQTLKGA